IPLILLSVPLTMAVNGDDFDTFWRSLTLAALGIVAISLWTFLLHLTVLRNRSTKPASIPVVLVLGFITGAIYGGVNYFGAPLVDLAVPPRPLAKTILTAIFGLWWGVGTTLFLEARDRFHKARLVLIEKAVQIERLRMHENNVVTALRKTMNDEVAQIVSDRLKELSHKEVFLAPNVAPKNWRFISSFIRSTSNTAVRPLSHRLRLEKSLQYPPPSFTTVFLNVLRTQPFRPTTIGILYVISTGPSIVQAFGPLDAAINMVLAVCAIYALFVPANLLMQKYPQYHSRIYITTLVILELSTVYSSIERNIALGADFFLASTLTSVLASLALVVSASTFGSLRGTHLRFLSAFESEIDRQEIELIARSQLVAEIARDTAQVLHGSVQSRLNSCALAIEQASRSGNLEQCQEAFKLALQTLARPLDAAIVTDGLTPEAVIEYVSEPWQGLCEIEAYVDELHIPHGALPSKSLTYFLEEAVSNAVRHGHARSIFILIEKQENEFLAVTVVDDGIGLAGARKSLSPRLKELTGGSVTIDDHENGGAILQASFGFVTIG
ncbi:MAG: hypothetical protein RIS75_206, partial [Actinomycetota bacterium]